MKAYFKTFWRMFKKHITRFISLIAIIIISIGFMSGLGESADKLKYSVRDYYLENNVPDFIIKGQSLTSGKIRELKDKFGEDNVDTETVIDCFANKTDDGYAINMPTGSLNGKKTDEDIVYRLYFTDIGARNVDNVKLIEGKMPEGNNEILAERKTASLKGLNIGDKITVKFNEYLSNEYTVCGIAVNPLYFSLTEEGSYIEKENPVQSGSGYLKGDIYKYEILENILYLPNMPYLPVTDVNISVGELKTLMPFTKAYKNKMNEIKEEITELIGEDGEFTVLSLYENYSFYSLFAYAGKVTDISIIFMIFFMLVTALVVLSTMTRLIEEERSQIACFKTLGFSSAKIIMRYILFALFAVLLGSVPAYFVGMGLTYIIFVAFGRNYLMPPMTNSITLAYFFITLAVILFATLFTTFYTCYKTTRRSPAELLKPKTPKAGKKVFLEKIKFIWNRLSFKYKSCLRNVLRYKRHFLMTVISIIGSSVLVLGGGGILVCALKEELNSEALVVLAVALVAFAAALTALVVYNLTNITVSERNREIATLMVLGYTNKEVTGYIFREIYIMSIIGALLGLPFGAVFLKFVFDFLEFGGIHLVDWYVWIISPVVTLFFTALSTLLLRRKIIKTDMNASLKSIE